MTLGRNQVLRYAILALQATLVGLAMFWVVKAIITLTNPESLWQPVNSASTTVPGASSPVSQSVNLSYDPFHRNVMVTEDIIEQPGEDAPETTLALTLKGRRVADNGTATIETPDGGQRTYKIGDEIVDGVTLKSVTPGYIVLSQNGRLERLTLEGSEETGLRTLPPEIPTASGMTAQTFLSSVSLKPVSENGQILGVEVRARRQGVDLKRFGLQPGDIITHVGTEDLTQGPPRIERLLSQFSAGNQPQIKLIRGGQPVIVELKL